MSLQKTHKGRSKTMYMWKICSYQPSEFHFGQLVVCKFQKINLLQTEALNGSHSIMTPENMHADDFTWTSHILRN